MHLDFLHFLTKPPESVFYRALEPLYKYFFFASSVIAPSAVQE